MTVFVVAFSAGTTTDMKDYTSEVGNLTQEFTRQAEEIDRNGIFFNNLRISLGMFIPAIGIGFGISTGFSTGFMAMAIAESSPLLSNVSPFADLIKPFGVMEIAAYGLAISRSGILIYQIIKKRHWRGFVLATTVEIGIVTAVLFIAAAIEWNTITSIDGPASRR